jgi:alpha-tubulin suppressor-like RCC1 family protein
LGLSQITSVTTSRSSAYALKSDGTVWAWGSNRHGELGDGTTTDRSTPVQVVGLSEITSVTTQYHYEAAYALKSDGTVWAWGSNSSGLLLGDGITDHGQGEYFDFSSTPVQVSGLTQITDLFAGSYASAWALQADGTVWAWGDNGDGQLGEGTTTDRSTPTKIPDLTGVVNIFPTPNLRDSDGPGDGQSVLALTSDGLLHVWGYTGRGIIGNGTAQTVTTSPTLVDGPQNVVTAAGNIRGWLFAVTADGTVWTWGHDYYGNRSDGTTVNQNIPQSIPNLSDVTMVAASYGTNLALKTDGTVCAWGSNDSGQLGDGTTTDRTTPVQVVGLSQITSVTTSGSSAYALKSDGTVWAWGSNDSGQLGDGSTTDRSTPVQVVGLSEITSVTASYDSAYALKSDGTVWAWGDNSSGQLGDGTTTDRRTPVQVVGLSQITSVTASYDSAYALKSDGTVWAWGYNGYGQLGDGTTTDRSTPVQVVGLSEITSVTTSGSSAYALRSDGTVWAWGDNYHGQLGDGTTTSRSTPVQVVGLSGITSITTLNRSVCALRQDGTVWAWGLNDNGQLGDGLTDHGSHDEYGLDFSTTPVQVVGLTNVINVTAGDGVAFAVMSDGVPSGPGA